MRWVYGLVFDCSGITWLRQVSRDVIALVFIQASLLDDSVTRKATKNSGLDEEYQYKMLTY